MIEVGNVLVSDEIVSEHFVCNLEKCKGACCIEGELGAPLEEDELLILEDIYPIIKPYLTPEAIHEIEQQGVYVNDEDGDFSTPTIEGKECVYAFYDNQKILKCAIEQAYLDKKIKWKKPISCHLYPIRAQKYSTFTALNYDRWDICSDACSYGEKLKVPLYQFLKEPMIRKFGKKWYEQFLEILGK